MFLSEKRFNLHEATFSYQDKHQKHTPEDHASNSNGLGSKGIRKIGNALMAPLKKKKTYAIFDSCQWFAHLLPRPAALFEALALAEEKSLGFFQDAEPGGCFSGDVLGLDSKAFGDSGNDFLFF